MDSGCAVFFFAAALGVFRAGFLVARFAVFFVVRDFVLAIRTACLAHANLANPRGAGDSYRRRAPVRG